jgi:hypothetical protein
LRGIEREFGRGDEQPDLTQIRRADGGMRAEAGVIPVAKAGA